MRAGRLALAAAIMPTLAHADAPLGYLTGYGTRAYPVAALTWGLLAISIIVILIVAGLLVGAVLRRRQPLDPKELAVSHTGGGLRWITVGVAISGAVLFGSCIWTLVTIAATASPPGAPGLTLEVTGHQWWWEVRYLGQEGRTFTTANEIHIPVGQPVLIRLHGADVIHSFWVPALTGKTDTIPGQTNVTWLEADAPGVYRGQCTEYCGEQHAHMGLIVFADQPDDFKAWWDHQLEPAPQPADATVAAGEETFLARCGACHAVRGTQAGGIFGPDLSHLMTRTTLAAGTLPNTVGYLSGWISDPQVIKPGSRMPTLDLPGPDLAKIRQFLETLH